MEEKELREPEEKVDNPNEKLKQLVDDDLVQIAGGSIKFPDPYQH